MGDGFRGQVTFIGPIVTDAARLHERCIPVALALFGIGMAVGNAVGGWLADRHPARGLLAGFGTALVARRPGCADVDGAMNLSALNVANARGA